MHSQRMSLGEVLNLNVCDFSVLSINIVLAVATHHRPWLSVHIYLNVDERGLSMNTSIAPSVKLQLKFII